MSRKLKFTLGILVVVAGFLLTRIGLTIKKSAETASRIRGESTIIPEEESFLTKDSDSDGLSDYDEVIYATDPFSKDTDGDGYLDGEEVASRYDPLDPSSNNQSRVAGVSLISPTANLTDRVLNLSVASLIDDSGEFDPTRVTPQTYADILTSIDQEGALSILIPSLSDSDIKIIEDNSPKSVEKYLKSLTLTLEEGLFSVSGDIGLGVNDIATPNSTYFLYYENATNTLRILEVPSSWKEIHKTTILAFAHLANSFKILRNLEEDPVRAGFALVQVQSSFLSLTSILNTIVQLAIKQNIPLDSIMQMLLSTNGFLPSPQ